MKNRPINLDLSTMSFPVTAIVSICHRISGVILLFISLIGAILLRLSVFSANDFQSITSFDYEYSWIVKIVLWLFYVIISYHIIAGIRHMIMDFGIGESLRCGRVTSWLLFLFVLLFSIFLGFYIGQL